ncbi:MAG: DUF2142 domain-containing protein [Lachnospiraceae bacterium]|nr:DUF2142 domain-containing protein [Lachnospiraceae bacterium]
MKKNIVDSCRVLMSCIAITLMSFVLISIVSKNHSVGTWLGVGLFSMFFVVASYIGIGKEDFFEHIYNCCLVVFLVVVGIIQVSQIDRLRFTPIYDLDAIYGGAIQWVETGSFSNYYDYFYWFPNNLGGLCLLYFVFRIGSFLGADYFVMAAGANEIILLVTLALISLTTKKLWGSKCGMLAMGLSICMLPLLFMADAFYTDSLSIAFPIGLFYLALKIEECEKQYPVKLCFFSGIVTAVGSLIKPTVLIMTVAVCLSFLLRKKWKKAVIYVVSVGILYFIITLLFHSWLYGNYLDPELAEIKNTPSYHWVMMGLKGDGGYNPEDYNFTRSFTNPEVRDEALKNEIINRISQKGVTGMLGLYVAKIFRCFGDGTLGLSDFLDDYPLDYSLLHEYLLYGGKKYKVYQNLCNSVFYMMLVFMFIYAISAAKNKRKPEGALRLGFAPILGISGMIVFLMHWETSPRYITNYVPIIIVLAIGGIRDFERWRVEKGQGMGKVEMALNEADQAADKDNRRMTHEEVFGNLRRKINVQ